MWLRNESCGIVLSVLIMLCMVMLSGCDSGDEVDEVKVNEWIGKQPINVGEPQNETTRLKDGRNISKGTTLMHFAAAEGRVDVMKWLKKQGEIVNPKDDMGFTPIHSAAGFGQLEAMKWLKKEGANINDKSDPEKIVPILLAVGSGNLDAVKWLKQQGANINCRGSLRDYSPLQIATQVAIQRGTVPDLEMVKLLIKLGADVNADCTIHFFIDNFPNLEMVKFLIKHGGNVNHKDDSGTTPMLLAAKRKNLEMMKLLKLHGADINTKNNYGHTPIGESNIEIREWLKANGAKDE